MAWFRRKADESGGKASKVTIAEGLWIKCDSCKEIMYRAEVERAGRVCPKCHYPFRISARERIAVLADPGSFEERETGLATTDPLSFKDTKKYRERVRAAAQKTSTDEAVVCGLARIGGQPAVLAAFEFGFLGGSMGSVVGEKLTRAIELAIDKHLPVVIVSASGGARMQEGILSLMQMPRTIVAADMVKEAGLPYIVLLTDPTTGGVSASFAMLGDITLAEPGAVIGFAGARVIEETIREKLPERFQRAEYLYEHGMVDQVVPRGELRATIARLLSLLREPYRADPATPLEEQREAER